MPNQSLNQKRFGEHAQAYVTSTSHSTGADLDLLLDLAQPQSYWRALDIATGGGHTALKFAPHVAHVTVTDLTPAMLEAAQAHLISKGVANATYQQAAAEDLPFDDASFDLITCRIAPHHFDDAAEFVKEAARVLKPGGVFLMQDHLMHEDAQVARYIEAFEKLRDPSHNRAYSEREWRTMFADAGLDITDVVPLFKDLNFEDWATRQGVTSSTIDCLNALVDAAPSAVRERMHPQYWGTPQATFRCHHVIIKAVK